LKHASCSSPVLSSAKYRNFFDDGSQPVLIVNIDGGTEWTCYDVHGTTSTGTIAGGSVAPYAVTPTPPGGTSTFLAGWYRLVITGPGYSLQNPLAAGNFIVVPPDSNIISAPLWNATSNGGDPLGVGLDQVIHALALFGVERYQITETENPTSQIQSIISDLQFEWQWYNNPNYQDPFRPRPQFIQFPSNFANNNYSLATPIAASVRQGLIEAGIDSIEIWYEGPSNELSNLPSSNPTAVASMMSTFAEAIWAGDPKAHIMGPCIVTIDYAYINWFNDFLGALAESYKTDPRTGLSWHGYNTVNGDLQMGTHVFTQLSKVLEANNASHLPMWQSETGEFTDVYGNLHWGRSALWTLRRYLAQEAGGVPKERNYFFYDTSHGFWDFPSFFETNSQLAPSIAALRQFSARVFGRPFSGMLDFGKYGNFLLRGFQFASPADGGNVVVLMTVGSDALPIALGITQDSQVNVWDWAGNVNVMSVENGYITVEVGSFPVYVETSSQATVYVIDYWNALSTAGEDLAISAENVTSPLLNNLMMEDGFYFSSGGTTPDDPPPFNIPENSTGFFAPIEFYWNSTRSIARVILIQAAPWQSQSAVVSGSVAARIDGVWTNIGLIGEPATWINQSTPDGWSYNAQPIPGFVQTYWEEKWVWQVLLSDPVECDAIQVVCHEASNGGEPQGVPSLSEYGQGGDPNFVIREVLIFGPSAPVNYPSGGAANSNPAIRLVPTLAAFCTCVLAYLFSVRSICS